MNSKMSFREHIPTKANVANRNLGIIFRTFLNLDKSMFLQLYKSHLDYASTIWSREWGGGGG